LLRIERQVSETRGQFAKGQSRITTATITFPSQADEEFARSRGDLAMIEENINSAQDTGADSAQRWTGKG